MRHFRLPGAVTLLTSGVGMTTTPTRLIASSGVTQGAGTHMLRTAVGAIALAVVAVAANEDWSTAAATKVTSSRRFHRQ
jgi:hypothetical protein